MDNDRELLGIEAIRARHAAATKGPYLPDFDKRDDGAHQVVYLDQCGALPTTLTLCFMAIEPGNEQSHNDTVFLAASWQDVANLIAEVDRLRAENAAFARLEKWLKDHPRLRFVEVDYCDKYRMLFVENDGGDAGPQTGTGEGPTLAATINAALDAAGAER